MTDATEPANTDPDAITRGTEVKPATTAERESAAERAFDYRGDVTLHLTDGRVVEGYLFDRKLDGDASCVRIMPSEGSGRETILLNKISRVVFSGRDTAAGKSWETWVTKYQEKKARGEAANIEPDALD